MLKRLSFLILLFVFLLLPQRSLAQSQNGRRLQFVYIEHELQTPVSTIIRRMKKRYDEVDEFADHESMVVFLSSGQRPFVAFVNLKEYEDENSLRMITPSGQSRDNRDAFDNVLEAMNNANSHTVDASSDVKNILDILDGLKVFSDEGTLNFRSLVFDFYVGPSFWAQRNNEKIIARLYAVLQMGVENASNITFNVYKPKGIQLDYTDGMPYGERNLNDINSKLRIVEY